ncbi:MAG: RNA methyltransferase [Candidatus Kapaibacterium sp.]|jgi:tRNA G18 (ribose-2'-O)-methylase SpoU|nr:RNA methyltransferase [Candidatus Kapabacteria bacterium]
MMLNEPIKIESINDSRIRYYKSMKDNLVDKLNNGLFIAEGDKVVLKLLESNHIIISILAKYEFFQNNESFICGHPDVELLYADEVLLKDIIGFKMHTGVMALAMKPKPVNLKELGTTIVCLNGIVDSENVGSIVRNASAFGIKSIMSDNATSSPYLRRAVRVSMGQIFSMRYYRSNELFDDLKKLKTSHQIISAENHERAESLFDNMITGNKVIIFGNESTGISDDLLGLSDYIIKIPIENGVASINVATSSGIILSFMKYCNYIK